MGNIGIPELIIFAVILLLLFGAKRIPEIMRSVGTGMREFKEGITDIDPRAELNRPETEATSVKTAAQDPQQQSSSQPSETNAAGSANG